MKNILSDKRLRSFTVPLFSLITFVFLLPCIATAQTRAANIDNQLQYWRTYAFEDVNFKVSFPAEPNRLSATTAFEDVEGIAYVVSTTGAMFQVLQVNLPAVVNGEDLKSHFDIMMDFGIKQVEAKFGDLVIVSDKNISKGNIQGREYVLERGTISAKLKFFLQGKKIFVIGMTRINLPNMPDHLEKIYRAEADKFFNSFQIVDNKPQGVRKTKGKAK